MNALTRKLSKREEMAYRTIAALEEKLADMRERLQLIADNSDDKNVVEICRFALEQK